MIRLIYLVLLRTGSNTSTASMEPGQVSVYRRPKRKRTYVCTYIQRPSEAVKPSIHDLSLPSSYVTCEGWPFQRPFGSTKPSTLVWYIHSRKVIHGDLRSHNYYSETMVALSQRNFGGSRFDKLDCRESPSSLPSPRSCMARNDRGGST